MPSWRNVRITPLRRDEIKEADYDARPVIVLMRSCDIHAVKRLDQMYTGNGPANDWFYERLRDRVKFALIGCGKACPNSFCVDMGTNRTNEYAFSIDMADGKVYCDVRDDELKPAFESTGAKADVSPRYVTEAEFRVERPEEVPVELFKDKMWDEYTKRCVNVSTVGAATLCARHAHALPFRIFSILITAESVSAAALMLPAW